MKRLILAIIAAFAVLLTIQVAAATTFNISEGYTLSWKKLGDDIAAYRSASFEITYYNSTGLVKTINTTPVPANDFIRQGVTNGGAGVYDEEDIFWIRPADQNIYVADYSAGTTVELSNQSGVLEAVVIGAFANQYVPVFASDEVIYFTYPLDGAGTLNIKGVRLTTNNSLVHVNGITTSTVLGCHYYYDAYKLCGETFTEINGADNFTFYKPTQHYDFAGNNITNYLQKYEIIEVNTTHSNATPTIESFTVANDTGEYLGFASCYDDSINVYCYGNGYEYAYDKEDPSLRVTSSTATRDGLFIDYDIRQQKTGNVELYVNDTGETYVYNNGNLTTLQDTYKSTTTYRQFQDALLLEDAVIHRITSTIWEFITFDELEEYSGPNATNETNATLITNLTVTIKDWNTEDPLEDVNVTVNNTDTSEYLTSLTDINGQVSFIDIDAGEIIITATKEGYISSQATFTLTEGENRSILGFIRTGTSLAVTIKDWNTEEPIENALVSYTNQLTYTYEYDYTDENGTASFADIESGNVIVTASKSGYDTGQTTFNVVEGENNTLLGFLQAIGTTSGTYKDDRDCIDDGLWLCGPDELVTTACINDSDCPLSNDCTPGINKCSRFNYSACDEADLPRGQRCIAKLTAEGGLNNITNWMLGNLLWVVIIFILVVFAGMVFISWKK